ncbi:uncharacterized protein [Dermacentor albipictus]|uniref:uncharacterized protein n=1 Tax=Dermacentor albipictus TaxID=60249 RepID=UPI0038FCE26C
MMSSLSRTTQRLGICRLKAAPDTSDVEIHAVTVVSALNKANLHHLAWPDWSPQVPAHTPALLWTVAHSCICWVDACLQSHGNSCQAVSTWERKPWLTLHEGTQPYHERRMELCHPVLRTFTANLGCPESPQCGGKARPTSPHLGVAHSSALGQSFSGPCK